MGGGDEIRLTPTPSPVPAAPEPIYPGGALSAPIRTKIYEYVDSLGPARGTAADPNQDWDDTLRPAKISASIVRRIYEDGTASGVPGVQDCTVVTPAANVVPTDHVGGTVDLIVIDDLRVRPA